MSIQGLPTLGAVLTVSPGKQVRYYLSTNSRGNNPPDLVLTEGQTVGKFTGLSEIYNSVLYLYVDADTSSGRLRRWIIADYVTWSGKTVDFDGGKKNVIDTVKDAADPDSKNIETGYTVHIVVAGVLGYLVYNKFFKNRKRK